MIASGTIHEITPELIQMLQADGGLLAKRNSLTPLARNEWICRVTIPKQEVTKTKHLFRLREDILAGKKRPCCRPGCPHHRESAKKRFTGIE